MAENTEQSFEISTTLVFEDKYGKLGFSLTKQQYDNLSKALDSNNRPITTFYSEKQGCDVYFLKIRADSIKLKDWDTSRFSKRKITLQVTFYGWEKVTDDNPPEKCFTARIDDYKMDPIPKKIYHKC